MKLLGTVLIIKTLGLAQEFIFTECRQENILRQIKCCLSNSINTLLRKENIMNKKILIGCIIAVVILILVSFTGVVGYQTTKSSDVARTSPLFSIRSTRAIDKESKDLTCDYVGKGVENSLSIPREIMK